MDEVKEHYTLNLQAVIGRGAYACVYGGQRKCDSVPIAAKVIEKPRDGQRDSLEKAATIKREVEIMQQLQHPDVVRLLGQHEDAANCVLIMELVPGGELFDFLTADESIDEAIARGFVRQLLQILVYLHDDLMIMHLDIKPENLLLNAEHTRLKLIDFGLAHRYEPHRRIRKMIGTPEFVAPEVCALDPITPAADVWAVGVLSYIMLTGFSPFLGDDDGETLSNVSVGEAEFEDEDVVGMLSDNSLAFLQYCLHPTVLKRPSAKMCLAHAWLSAPLRSEHSLISLSTKRLRAMAVRRRFKETAHAIHFAYLLCHCRRYSRQEEAGIQVSSSDTQVFPAASASASTGAGRQRCSSSRSLASIHGMPSVQSVQSLQTVRSAAAVKSPEYTFISSDFLAA